MRYSVNIYDTSLFDDLKRYLKHHANQPRAGAYTHRCVGLVIEVNFLGTLLSSRPKNGASWGEHGGLKADRSFKDITEVNGGVENLCF